MSRSTSTTSSSSLLATAILSAACFGTLAIFTSLAYERGATPLQLLTLRFALAAFLLGGYLGLTNPVRLVAPIEDVGRYAVISVAGYGAASICFFFALTYADAAVVAIILYTYPAIVALAERVFFKIRLSNGKAAAVALTFGGCVLVIMPGLDSPSMSIPGVALGFGAAAGYALFTVVSHRWLAGRPRTTLMTYLFMFTAVLCAGLATTLSVPLTTEAWDAATWMLLAGIVLLPTFAAILLYLHALRGLGPSRAAIISTFEPVFTIALAAIVLGQHLVAVQMAGAMLVLGGVIVAEKFASEPAIV